MPVNSAIMNAADPIMGGSRLPPVDAATSTAPARVPEYPKRFIIGIVMNPVVTTSEVGLPETVQTSADEKTATFAGPPGVFPDINAAILKKKSPPFAFSRKVPNITKTKAYVAATLMGTPKSPSDVKTLISRK